MAYKEAAAALSSSASNGRLNRFEGIGGMKVGRKPRAEQVRRCLKAAGRSSCSRRSMASVATWRAQTRCSVSKKGFGRESGWMQDLALSIQNELITVSRFFL